MIYRRTLQSLIQEDSDSLLYYLSLMAAESTALAFYARVKNDYVGSTGAYFGLVLITNLNRTSCKW
jgi:hypothetical protein